MTIFRYDVKNALLYSLILSCLLLPTAYAASYSGGTGEAGTPFLISTPEDLQALSDPANSADWDKYFELTQDIDMSGVTGFIPIAQHDFAYKTTAFTGHFDGKTHVILNLSIHLPENDLIGLFGHVKGSSIKDVGIEDGSFSGRQMVGSLVGLGEACSISNCYSTSTVSGGYLVGGLFGAVFGDMSNYKKCYIASCYATGFVNNDSDTDGLGGLGGLIGGTSFSELNTCYSHSIVAGEFCVGGLIGQILMDTKIDTCYATGSVSGEETLGGLIGGIGVGNYGNQAISNCYATGAVSGRTSVGGLVGEISYDSNMQLDNCYSTGFVSGGLSFSDKKWVGGLIGYFGGEWGLTNLFWDTETSGTNIGIGEQSSFPGIEGKTTSEMRMQSTFDFWTFDASHWAIQEGATRPYLAWQKKAVMNGAATEDGHVSTGYVYNAAGANIVEYGYLYQKDVQPTLDNGIKAGVVTGVNLAAGTGAVIPPTTLPLLDRTNYYIRAYCVDANERVQYGDTTQRMVVFPVFIDFYIDTIFTPMLYQLELTEENVRAYANVPGTFAFDPPIGSILGAGTHTVTAIFTPEDTEHYRVTTKSIIEEVVALPVSITLSNLSYSYDGLPKTVTAATSIADIELTITYNGDPIPPTEPGEYSVVAVVADPNCTGEKKATMTIHDTRVETFKQSAQVGNNVFLQVPNPGAAGNGDFSWVFQPVDGSAAVLSGETDSVLRLLNVQQSASGTYIASFDDGSKGLQTVVFELTVESQPMPLASNIALALLAALTTLTFVWNLRRSQKN